MHSRIRVLATAVGVLLLFGTGACSLLLSTNGLASGEDEQDAAASPTGTGSPAGATSTGGTTSSGATSSGASSGGSSSGTIPPFSAGDAAAAGRRCGADATFGAPKIALGLQTATDEAEPRLTPDELVVYFTRMNGGGTYELWSATRGGAAAAFTNLVAFAAANVAPYSTEGAGIGEDGLTLVFGSDRPGGSGAGISSSRSAPRRAARSPRRSRPPT